MVNQEERLDRVMARVERVRAAPSLRMVNGTGQALFGRLHLPGLENRYFSMLFGCILFVPLLPHAVYLVEEGEENYYKFYGKIGLWKLLGLLSPTERNAFLYSTLRPVLVRIALLVMAILLMGGAMRWFR